MLSSLPVPFNSLRHFHQAFRQGLADVAGRADLGSFILAYANILSDEELYTEMLPEITAQYQHLAKAVAAGGVESGQVSTTAEDRHVFELIQARGVEAILPVQYRRLGPWRCQYNELRTLRPKRMAGQRIDNLYQPFSAEGFHFNKPFLQQERLWQGAWHGRDIAWYYNKFPFARFHGLLVQERLAQKPQYLEEEDHQFAWQWVEQLADHFSGIGLAYNAIGAYASVNHLHFQWFIEPDGLPVMLPEWNHHGGALDYPIACRLFTDNYEAWDFIDTCQQQSMAFNLIYTPGLLYAMPRKLQGHFEHADWTAGFSWIECGGEVVVQNEVAFHALTAQAIEAELTKISLLPGN